MRPYYLVTCFFMSLREHAASRARALSLAAALSLVAGWSSPRPPARTLEGLAELLGRAAESAVRPSDVVWEPSRGALVEALFGRRVLFLGAGSAGVRDVFRATVRVSFEGQPVKVLSLRNLTGTPLGDESGLQVRGDTAVFATTALGRIQGVTSLDLGGVSAAERPSSLLVRGMFALASYAPAGAPGNPGRASVVWAQPPRAARLELLPSRLEVTTEDPPSSVVLQLADGRVAAEGMEVHLVRAERHAATISEGFVTLSHALALEPTLRSMTRIASWAGDGVHRTVSAPLRALLGPRFLSRESPEAPLPDGDPARTKSFSPPDLAPEWEPVLPGEGRFTDVTLPFLARLPGGAAERRYFRTAFVRTDPDRPWAEVYLVAMDLRVLELAYEGGYEAPRSLFGPPGTGRVPASVTPRLVAAFDGMAGSEGAMVRGRPLVPARPGLATVVVTTEGDLGLGRWPALAPPAFTADSYRQAAQQLLEFPASGLPEVGAGTFADAARERSALCRLPSGHLVHAWGREVSARGLVRALSRVGCESAVPLDPPVHGGGFAFLRATGPDPARAEFAAAAPGMTATAARFLRGSSTDFFYVLLRAPGPRDGTRASWAPSQGGQPEPPFLPGVYESVRELGDVSVRVVSVEPGRVEWALRAGTEEPANSGSRSKKIGLDPALLPRALVALGLGHTTEALRYGLAFDGQPSLDMRQAYATVVVASGGPPRIFPPGERPSLAPGEDAVQLPLLADRGAVDSKGGDRGGTRERGALCVSGAGRVLVATGRHDSNDPVASALVGLGCSRVVGLDRGSRHAAFVHRAGTAEPPAERYEGTALYALDRPMVPHSFRLGAERAVTQQASGTP